MYPSHLFTTKTKSKFSNQTNEATKYNRPISLNPNIWNYKDREFNPAIRNSREYLMLDQNINIESSPEWTILRSTYSKSTCPISIPNKFSISCPYRLLNHVRRNSIQGWPPFFLRRDDSVEKVEVATSNRGIGGKSNSKASTAERAQSVFGQPSSRTLVA